MISMTLIVRLCIPCICDLNNPGLLCCGWSQPNAAMVYSWFVPANFTLSIKRGYRALPSDSCCCDSRALWRKARSKRAGHVGTRGWEPRAECEIDSAKWRQRFKADYIDRTGHSVCTDHTGIPSGFPSFGSTGGILHVWRSSRGSNSSEGMFSVTTPFSLRDLLVIVTGRKATQLCVRRYESPVSFESVPWNAQGTSPLKIVSHFVRPAWLKHCGTELHTTTLGQLLCMHNDTWTTLTHVNCTGFLLSEHRIAIRSSSLRLARWCCSWVGADCIADRKCEAYNNISAMPSSPPGTRNLVRSTCKQKDHRRLHASMHTHSFLTSRPDYM